jgi:deoxyribose-phosphate aldolase
MNKMNNLTSKEIARLIDISAVRAESTLEEVSDIVESALKYNFICVFSMPSFLPDVIEELKDAPQTGVGGIVGFPSGGETTTVKVFQATELKEIGCKEIDMVLNIGKLKSGLFDDVLNDIRQVKAAVSPLPLKVIMEVALLTDEEISKASFIIKEAGADFIKTGTGWAGSTTMHHIDIIKQSVGDTINLKVAGGVRSLDTLLEMYYCGVTRFGIGYKAALNIMEEARNRENN